MKVASRVARLRDDLAELEELAKTPDTFITFSDVDRFGINPAGGSFAPYPHGLYGYFLDDVIPARPRFGLYAAGRKYAFVFRGDTSRLFDPAKVTGDDVNRFLDVLAEDLDGFADLWERLRTDFFPEFDDDPDDYVEVGSMVSYDGYNKPMGGPLHPAQKLWIALRKYFDPSGGGQSQAERTGLKSALRSLGFEGIYDRQNLILDGGNGTAEVVFFDPRDVELIARFDNPLSNEAVGNLRRRLKSDEPLDDRFIESLVDHPNEAIRWEAMNRAPAHLIRLFTDDRSPRLRERAREREEELTGGREPSDLSKRVAVRVTRGALG